MPDFSTIFKGSPVDIGLLKLISTFCIAIGLTKVNKSQSRLGPPINNFGTQKRTSNELIIWMFNNVMRILNTMVQVYSPSSTTPNPKFRCQI